MKRKRIVTASLIIVFIFVIILFGFDEDSNKHEGEARTPSSSSIQKGRNYKTVVEDFEKQGFKNIKTEKIEDLITGWITKDGEVEYVSVDGNKEYSPNTWYPNDVEVVITCHTFPEEEKQEILVSSSSKQEDMKKDNNDKPASTNQEDLQKDKIDELAKSALEKTFPVEYAKRSVVVAVTNYFATDVFKKDGNTYDLSKFHSYEDASGDVQNYFMNVESWGTWSVKNEKTWHVDSLILKNTYGTLANVSVDVNFDGKNYVLSNVKGTFGNPKNASDLGEMELGSDASLYLKVPESLVKNDRVQSEVDSLDHSKDLDKQVARKAFENYGKSLYPYGFECHWLIDLRNEEQTHEGYWIIKVGVTITNQYGTKRDTIAEGTIGGKTANPIVKHFYVSN